MNHMHATASRLNDSHIAWNAFSSHEACAEALANYVAEKLQHVQSARGTSSLVVSGGGTPVPMFKQLKTKALDWSNTLITLADERWVAPSRDDSNEKLVREHLLTEQAQFIPLKYDAPSCEEGAARAQKALADAIPNAFDVVVLGMGGDGHTASLFPNHASLPKGLAPEVGTRCIAIDHSPKPPAQRISLTAPALLNSQEIIIHITGDEKRDVLEQALQQNDATSLPIAAFVNQRAVPVSVYWAA